MNNKELLQELRKATAEKGLVSMMQTVASHLQRNQNVESALLKISAGRTAFHLNGKIAFCIDREIGSGSEAVESNQKEKKFLDRISIANVREIAANMSVSHLSSINFRAEVSPENEEIENLLKSAARLEFGIASIKDVSKYHSTLKQILMYNMFKIILKIEEWKPDSALSVLQIEVTKLLGYQGNEKARVLKKRLKKILFVGELAQLFGENVLLIPKLGIKTFYDFSEKSRNFIREEGKNGSMHIGNSIFRTSLQKLGKYS